jgi:hypothetical protein
MPRGARGARRLIGRLATAHPARAARLKDIVRRCTWRRALDSVSYYPLNISSTKSSREASGNGMLIRKLSAHREQALPLPPRVWRAIRKHPHLRQGPRNREGGGEGDADLAGRRFSTT